MPRFLYKAKKGPTEIIEGEIDAEDEDAALGKISALGLVPVKLDAASAEAPIKEKIPHSAGAGRTARTSETRDRGVSTTPSNPLQARIPYKDLHIFTRQFAILLKASVPLLRIFEILQTQTQNAKFRSVLKDMQNALREGASLSETLGRYPRIFSQVYLSMVHAGEVSGTLDKVLMRLAEFAEKEAEVRSRVSRAALPRCGVSTTFGRLISPGSTIGSRS